VEDHVMAHPAVQTATVVAVPHVRLGETVCAVVVLKPSQTLTLAGLTAFLQGRGIARFKMPERLEIWPVLPTTPSGKIQKFMIRKQLIEQSDEARHDRT
jgi:acyl-CoA synthetase